MSCAHFVVVVERVDRQADHLDVALVELGLDLGHVAELGGADRGEVLGVGEQHAPAVAEPLVEVDRALGGLGGEVGCGVAEANGHCNDAPCRSRVGPESPESGQQYRNPDQCDQESRRLTCD